MLHVILFQPEIPQNTGNVGRTCSIIRARLHLIHPLGFAITDRHLKRSGMDYWHALDVRHHADWEAFRASPFGPKRLFLFTTKAQRSFWDARFGDEDGLVFGREGSGAPDWLHDEIGESGRVTIPRFNDELRSLNLSASVSVAAFEAMRQLHHSQ